MVRKRVGRMRGLVAALALVLVLAGCSGSGRVSGSEVTDVRIGDGRGAEVGLEQVSQEEAESRTTGLFGDPCQSSADCVVGWCIPTEEGGRCSDLCDGECPPGWVCRPVDGDEGKTMVCLPELARLCRPCVEDAECRIVAGVLSDHCVVYGDEGAFCGTVCSGPQECPAGYVCQWMDTVSGDHVYQCAARDRVCECLPSWTEEGAWTHCGSTNEWGACNGTRQCELAGLSPCTAVSPAPEICNAADDDCDGNVDEGLFGESCTRDNETGICEGEEVCLDGQWTCDAPVPAEEACNGVDDDCDGDVDEGAIDTDLDTVPDCLDADDDNDTIEDELDNCPLQFNPDQADLDQDGLGDGCDPDMDGDGILNEADNCVDEANPLQEDLDQDGLGDVCDFCLVLPDDGLDSDGDLHGDACDVFPFDPAEWSDHDEDGLGDNGDEDDFDYGKLVYSVASPDMTNLETGKGQSPGGDWPHFRHDVRRTGHSSGKGDLKTPLALWRYYLGGMLTARKALLHDLDSDGTPELLAVSGGSVVAWRTTGEKVWETGVLGLGVEELIGATDLDGNGTAEILALRTQTSPGWWILRAKTGQVINGFTSFLGDPSHDSNVKLEVQVMDDVTGDGLPDVVVNANNYHEGTMWQVWTFPWGPEAPALWSENKDTAKQEFGMAVAGDVDGDGSLELITQSFDALMKVFDVPAKKGQPMPSTISCQFCTALGAFHAVDADGDGADELIVLRDGPYSYCDRVGLVDFAGGKCTLVWSRFDTSPAKIRVAAPWSTGVADLDGDGDLEIVVSVLDMAGDSKWHLQILDALTGTTLADVPDRIPFHVLDTDGAEGPEILVQHSSGDKIPSGAGKVSSVRFQTGKLVSAGLELDGVIPAYSVQRNTGVLKTTVHRWVEIYSRMGEMVLAGKADTGNPRGIFFSDPEMDGILNEVISVDLGTGLVSAQYAEIPPGVGLGVPHALDTGGKGFLALARNDGHSLMLDFLLAPASAVIKAGGYYNDVTRVADLDGDLVPEVLVQTSRSHTVVLHAPASSELDELQPQVVRDDSRTFSALLADGGAWKVLVQDRSDPGKLLLALLQPDLETAVFEKDMPPTTQLRRADPLSVGAKGTPALVLQLQNQNDSTDNSLSAFSALDGTLLWGNPGVLPMAGRGGTSVDLDGQPGEEYLTCSTGNECSVFSGGDGTLQYGLNKVGKYYIGMPYTAMAADLDGKGPPELVTGGALYETGAFRLDSTAPWTFTQLWESVAATQSAPALAFVDDDALPDVIYWNSEEGLVARRGLDGAVLWQTGLSGGAVVSSAVGKNIRLGHPAVGDVDGDGDDDVLIGSPDGFLYCLDVKGLDMLWSIYFRAMVGEPVLADVDGKGLDEILVPVADGYVYLLDQPGD